jgi:hypothetical protein
MTQLAVTNWIQANGGQLVRQGVPVVKIAARASLPTGLNATTDKVAGDTTSTVS